MWGGFALFWEVGVIASGGPPFFVLWGIPFVIMGMYFIFGRFWFKRRQKLRTAYGITNERAIVAVGSSQLMETPIKNHPLSLTRSSDGRHGSVQFGSGGPRWGGVLYANTSMDFFVRQSAGSVDTLDDVEEFDRLQQRH